MDHVGLPYEVSLRWVCHPLQACLRLRPASVGVDSPKPSEGISLHQSLYFNIDLYFGATPVLQLIQAMPDILFRIPKMDLK